MADNDGHLIYFLNHNDIAPQNARKIFLNPQNFFSAAARMGFEGLTDEGDSIRNERVFTYFFWAACALAEISADKCLLVHHALRPRWLPYGEPTESALFPDSCALGFRHLAEQ